MKLTIAILTFALLASGGWNGFVWWEDDTRIEQANAYLSRIDGAEKTVWQRCMEVHGSLFLAQEFVESHGDQEIDFKVEFPDPGKARGPDQKAMLSDVLSYADSVVVAVCQRYREDN